MNKYLETVVQKFIKLTPDQFAYKFLNLANSSPALLLLDFVS